MDNKLQRGWSEALTINTATERAAFGTSIAISTFDHLPHARGGRGFNLEQDLAQGANIKKAAQDGAAVPEVFRRSVKVVAGARNCLYLLLFASALTSDPSHRPRPSCSQHPW